MTRLDEHGQPVAKAFNQRRNEEKAVYVLRGILQGVASNEITPSEALYLDEWVRKQEYLSMEGDALDLVCCIKDIMEDGLISDDEMHDIKGVIDTILTYGVPQSPYEETRINEFLGLLKGTCADRKLDLSEIDDIENWIDRNADLADKFPVEPVYDRIRAAKSDGKIDQSEHADLYSLLLQLTGETVGQKSDIHGSVASVFSDIIDGFEHGNQKLCFTGKFLFGTRKQCEEKAVELGATTTSGVSQKVTTVVIGTVTSRDWMFDNFGRKIESALGLRKKYGLPTILSEEQWITAIRQNSN